MGKKSGMRIMSIEEIRQDEKFMYGVNVGDRDYKQAIAKDESGEHQGMHDLCIRFNRMMNGSDEF